MKTFNEILNVYIIVFIVILVTIDIDFYVIFISTIHVCNFLIMTMTGFYFYIINFYIPVIQWSSDFF